MNPRGLAASARVTVGEIASFAGVRPSAVSNWRSRHEDFPLPVEQTAGGDLFDLESVIAWLESKGKAFTRPTEESAGVLWEVLEGLRAHGTMEEGVLLLMQWLFLCASIERHPGPESVRAKAALRRISADPRDATRAWEEALAHVPGAEAAAARLLSFPVRVTGVQLARAARLLERVGDQPRDWGQLATLLLRRSQEWLGLRGSAYSPESISALQVALLEPIQGVVYDPAAGVAITLAQAWRLRAGDGVRLVGQEVSEFNWWLGFLHLATIGARFESDTGDTLRDDRFRSLKADRVALDPPLGLKPPADVALGDDRWAFGVPRTSADWLWAQHLVYHLAADGVGVMTMAPGSLSCRGAEAVIRGGIVRAGVLDAVIELPPGVVAGTAIPVALLVFARQRANRSDRVLFVDGRQLGQSRRGKLHELEPSDIQRIVSIVGAWRSGSFTDEPRFAAAATASEILAGDADLSPKRYVRYSTRVTEIDAEPIATRLARLRSSVREQIGELDVVGQRIVEGVESFRPHEAEGEWRVVRLGELLGAEPQTGVRQDPDGANPAIPYIQTRLVSSGTGRLEQVPEEVTRGKVRQRLVSRGDVLLTSRGLDADSRVGCATVAFDGVAAYSESLIRLSPRHDIVDPDFLRWFLTSRQGRTALAAVTTGSVIANLRPEAVMEIEIRLPDWATQRAIVHWMREIERSLNQINDIARTGQDAFDTLREGVAAGLYSASSGDQAKGAE